MMPVGGLIEEWDHLDFIGAGGILVTTGGVLASLCPALRKTWILAPIAIGVGMMALAAYGARARPPIISPR
jgi:hypothetical protein